MWESALAGMLAGAQNLTYQQAIMIAIGLVLIWLGASRGFEPLLLVPIGFGAVLVNIPLAGLMEGHGMLKLLYGTLKSSNPLG